MPPRLEKGHPLERWSLGRSGPRIYKMGSESVQTTRDAGNIQLGMFQENHTSHPDLRNEGRFT